MIVKLELEEEDFAPIHDIVYDITGYSYTNKELEVVWNGLDELTQLDAAKWGMSDTEVRGQIYEHVENKLKE